MTIEQAELAEPLLAKASEYLPQPAVAKVKAAYEFAAGRHAGQLRRPGGPGITHPLRAENQIQAETPRKMFPAMAQDLRVVIIKLADRLHNMLTLNALPPEDQQR